MFFHIYKSCPKYMLKNLEKTMNHPFDQEESPNRNAYGNAEPCLKNTKFSSSIVVMNFTVSSNFWRFEEFGYSPKG